MKKSGSIKRPKLPPPTPLPLCKTTPNYMKSTTSSDARKEQLQRKSSLKAANSSSLGKRAPRTLTKNPSFKPAARKRNRVVVMCEGVDAKRATCSSTLKDCKFPAFLSLNPEGTSAVKVCPYTYCSLNGHHHPPLKTFLSARRHAIKTQRRAPIVEDDDDFNKRRITKEEESNDFFLEIYSAAENQGVLVEGERKEELAPKIVDFYEQDSDGSDMEWEIGYGGSPFRFDYDYGSSNEEHTEPDPDADLVINCKEGKDFCFDEVLMDEEVSQESVDEEGFCSDAFSSSDDGDSACLYDDMQNSNTVKTSSPLQVDSMEEEDDDEEEEEEEKKNILFEYNQEYEASLFSDLDQGHLPIEEAVAVENGEVAETEGIPLLRSAGSSKKPVQDDDDDELGDFNPRAPNFLPLEADPEAERVDLRHQDLDERKNSEEWMVDYALRQVVTNLGPARKRKVALLVEAFEKVMPTTKFDLHLSHATAFDQPRQMQACI